MGNFSTKQQEPAAQTLQLCYTSIQTCDLQKIGGAGSESAPTPTPSPSPSPPPAQPAASGADDVAGGGDGDGDGDGDVAGKRMAFLREIQKYYSLTEQELRSELLTSFIDTIFDYTGGVSSRTDPIYINMVKTAEEINLEG